MPVYLNGEKPMAGIKWIGSHPDNHLLGISRANALIILNDTKTNAPIAILDGSLISSMRTFAMSAIGIDRLCPHPKNIACIGMGKLGRMHAEMLPKLYPSIEKVFCFSKRHNYKDDLSNAMVYCCSSYQEAIRNADVVITTTAVSEPYIGSECIIGNKLLINLSLMDFKLEVYLNADSIIVDDWLQCTQAKKIFKEGVDKGVITRDKVFEISELIFSDKKNKILDGIIMFNPLGMAIEDIFVASAIYEKAKSIENIQQFIVA